MQKLKSKVEICKLPLMTPVFLPRYREVRKLPPSPHWSPSQGIPRKGQAPDQVTPWIAMDLPHAQVGLQRAFQQGSPGCSPLSSLSNFRPKCHGPCSLRYTVTATSQTRLISQDYKPLRCTTMVSKHRVVRGLQTSLNTRSKPRASA